MRASNFSFGVRSTRFPLHVSLSAKEHVVILRLHFASFREVCHAKRERYVNSRSCTALDMSNEN